MCRPNGIPHRALAAGVVAVTHEQLSRVQIPHVDTLLAGAGQDYLALHRSCFLLLLFESFQEILRTLRTNGERREEEAKALFLID